MNLADPSVRPHPSVSVVIPNWNGSPFLFELLVSLYGTSAASGLEVILVDNGSTDASARMAATFFPSVRLVERPANEGFARAVNRGLHAAGGEFLAVVNNDVSWDRDWLGPAAGFLDRHPDYDFAAPLVLNYFRRDVIDSAGDGLNRRLMPYKRRFGCTQGTPAPCTPALPGPAPGTPPSPGPAEVTPALPGPAPGTPALPGPAWRSREEETGPSPPTPLPRAATLTGAAAPGSGVAGEDILAASCSAVLFRRSFFDRVGAFDEDFFMYYEDVDLFLRGLLKGCRGRLLPALEDSQPQGDPALAVRLFPFERVSVAGRPAPSRRRQVCGALELRPDRPGKRQRPKHRRKSHPSLGLR